MKSSLSVTNLSIHYQTSVKNQFQIETIDHPVTDNISFEADNEKNIFITGKTGSGKTSILRSITGLIPVASGDIYVNEKLQSNNPANQRSEFIQYVPQSNLESFNPSVSVQSSLVNSVRKSVFQSTPIIKKEIEIFTELFELDQELLLNKPSKLSGGQLQRMGIIRALLAHPSVLLLDEPTSALHDELKFSVMNHIVSFAKQNGITLCVVSHDLKIVQQFADQVLHISNGKSSIYSIQNLGEWQPGSEN